MSFRNIRYYLKESFSNLVKNRLMSLASIVTVAVCIFMVIISYCISTNMSFMLEQMEDSIGITAIAEDDLESDKMTELLTKIEKINYVIEVKYVSPADGLEIMKEQLGEDSDILNGFEEDNPFSASFEIMVDGAENQSYVVEQLELLTGIKKVRHALTVTEMLVNIEKVVRIIGIILIVILCIVSIVIIINTIKLAVYIRKNEINIMKYVGATDWFIRWPFIIEGTIIGLIGAAIPTITTMLTYTVLIERIYEAFPIIQNVVVFKESADVFTLVIPITMLMGMLIGTLGSVFSVHKHLQV